VQAIIINNLDGKQVGWASITAATCAMYLSVVDEQFRTVIAFKHKSPLSSLRDVKESREKA